MASTTYAHGCFLNLTKTYHLGNITVMVRNAGQLGRVDRKIALLRYVERLPLPDIAAQTHYSRTAIGYRLKGIDKMLDM